MKSPQGQDREHKGTNRRRKGSGARKVLFILVGLLVLLAVARAFLPWVVRDYVNRTLDRDPMYSGRIGPVEIHLLRGAYSVHDVRLNKTTGNVPVPLLAASRIDFSIQWDALLHGKVVGRFLMEEPQLNFVDAPNEEEAQSGAGAPWLQMIQDLFPFKINSAVIKNGSVHFRSYQFPKPVDVYLSEFNGTIDDLTNIRDETTPLVTTVHATALAMDQAKMEYEMRLDPFSYRPTFHLAVRLLGLDVTKLNDLALAYGKFDFKRGWFDLVIETDAKEGQLKGYVKPLFRNLRVFKLGADIRQDNALQFFWQALLGGVTSLFKNRVRDQFGTLVPFSGDASGATSADILATIGNTLRNAFVRAYLPRLQVTSDPAQTLQFEAPDFNENLSTSGEGE